MNWPTLSSYLQPAQGSTSIREYIKERDEPNRCIYCGARDKLTLEHILPENTARIHLEYNTYGELLPLREATSITVELIELLKKIPEMKR